MIIILLIFLLVHAPSIYSAEYNYEVAHRVHERLTNYMQEPRKVLDFIDDYNVMDTSNENIRDSFYRIGDALMKTYKHTMIYYALEDGSFAGHFREPRKAQYREPGEAGYIISNDDGDDGTGTNNDMYKHYMSCVSDDGIQIPCQLKAGDKYIECVNGCSLEKCSGSSEEDIIWCKQYKEMQVEQDSKKVLGYIPRSEICIDKYGYATQEPESVSVHADEETTSSCYFNDGVTLVDRHLSGAFAYCNNESEGKASCDSTFVGAYTSKEYDPRYRSWYRDTRLFQKPNWSSVYIFSSGPIGLSYVKPIYQNNKGKKIFHGTLALDYELADLTSYFTTTYLPEKDIIVAIVERDNPNYMIASSTGSSAVKGNDRVSIHELSGHPLDVLVKKAWQRQVDEGFPDMLVAIEDTDHGVHVSETVQFMTPDYGIDWNILVLSPVDTLSEDTITFGDQRIAFIIVPSVFGALVCSILLVVFIKHRKEKEVVFADWR